MYDPTTGLPIGPRPEKDPPKTHHLAFLFPPVSEMTPMQVVWGVVWRVTILAAVLLLAADVLWAEYIDKGQANNAAETAGAWFAIALLVGLAALVLTSPVWSVLWWRSRRKR